MHSRQHSSVLHIKDTLEVQSYILFFLIVNIHLISNICYATMNLEKIKAIQIDSKPP